jgi:hypothetical protein
MSDQKRVIIAFTGKKRHGKDTCASVFSENKKILINSFARLLKYVVGILFCMDQDTQLNGCRKEEIDQRWGVTPRELLQVVGTDLFRVTLQKCLPHMELRPSLWVKRMEMWIDEVPTQKDIVITDCRFVDEACMIKRRGGVVVRVVRPGITEDDTHASETEQNNIEADYTIVNDGSILELHQKVSDLYKQLKHRSYTPHSDTKDNTIGTVDGVSVTCRTAMEMIQSDQDDVDSSRKRKKISQQQQQHQKDDIETPVRRSKRRRADNS